MGTINPAVAITNENSLQPFFVLHKAARTACESSGKSRRMPKFSDKSNDSNIEGMGEVELRLQSFHFFWSQIESIIENVLKNVSCDVFDKIACWIRESSNAIQSRRLAEPTKATKTYPLLHSTSFKQLFTALVCTNNMEFVDDIQTFGDLAQHLKSHGCHVANLSSLDFSAKMGVGGPLRRLLRQFLMSSTDVGDISILASWYCEQGNSENPIVVIIDGIERCFGPVLSDFIVMLSEWASKIPILLILGVTTNTDAVRDIIPSTVLNYLSLTRFILGSSSERMDRVIEAVLVKQCACLSLGHEVANFLRNYFLMHDGTLISFIRALKMASFQHFVLHSRSFTFTGSMEKKFSQDLSKTNAALIQERAIMKVFGLQYKRYSSHSSVSAFINKQYIIAFYLRTSFLLGLANLVRNNPVEPNDDNWDDGLSEMQRQCDNWASLVMCLYEAGKHQKVTLLDLYCAVLDPQMFKSRIPGEKFGLEYNNCKSSIENLLGQHLCLQKYSCISQAICGVRDLPAVDLYLLLATWGKLSVGLAEIHEKVEELNSFMMDRMPRIKEPADISKKHTDQSNISLEKDATLLFRKKASELASSMMRKFKENGHHCCNYHWLPEGKLNMKSQFRIFPSFPSCRDRLPVTRIDI